MKIFFLYRFYCMIGFFNYVYILFERTRFSQWSIGLLTNAVTIFMIGLVAEEISQLKFKKF